MLFLVHSKWEGSSSSFDHLSMGYIYIYKIQSSSWMPLNQMLCKRPADCISRSKQTLCSSNVWNTFIYHHRCRKRSDEWMTMREIKGGRHNIYLVSLTDTHYTHMWREEKKEGYILFLSFNSINKLQGK